MSSIYHTLTQDMLSSEMQNSEVPYFYFALNSDDEKSKNAKKIIESLSAYAEERGIRFIIHEGYKYPQGDKLYFLVDDKEYYSDVSGWKTSDKILANQMFQLNNVSFVARSFPSMSFFYRTGNTIYTPMLLPYTDEEAKMLKNEQTVIKTWKLYGYVDGQKTFTSTQRETTASHVEIGDKLYYKMDETDGQEHYRYILRGDEYSYLPDDSKYYKILESKESLTECIDGCIKYFGYEKTRYTVTFQDYDGTVLKIETVKKGNNATPPDNPTRDNYIFLKWDPSYENVQSDLTVIAQYMIDKNNPPQQQEEAEEYSTLTTTVISIDKFGKDTTKHTYSDYAEHKLRISSNVTRLNVYSSEED